MEVGTAATVGVILGGVGLGVGLYSAFAQAAAYSQMASMQSMMGQAQMRIMQQQGQLAIMQGEADSALYGYQASLSDMSAEEASLVIEYNEAMAAETVASIEQQTGYDLWSFRKYAEQFMGAQRAKYAKAGVEIDSGSPMDVLAMNRAAVEMEAYQIMVAGREEAVATRRGAALASYQGSTLVSQIQAQGAMDRVNAMAVRTQGQVSGLGYSAQGLLADYSAQMSAYNLNSQAYASMVGGIGNALSSGGGLFMNYAMYKKMGWGG